MDRSRAEIGNVWKWWLNPGVRIPNPLPESKIRQAYSHAVFFGFEAVRAQWAVLMRALAERA